MNSPMLNFIIGCVGLVSMLTGMIFLDKPMIFNPLTGIGGSVLATAIVNWIAIRQFGTIPINSIIESLAQRTEFIRTEQIAELTFTLIGDQVKLEKRHRYNLRKRLIPFRQA